MNQENPDINGSDETDRLPESLDTGIVYEKLAAAIAASGVVVICDRVKLSNPD